MRPLARILYSAARKPPLRSMATFAPGHVLQGAHWDYRIQNVVTGDKTHRSTVFKAQVVSREKESNVPEWAIIKTVSADDKSAVISLERECQSYRLPGVATDPCFRRMYEAIDSRTIALEWLDATLAEVKYQPDVRTNALIKAVLKETLTSCDVLDGHKYVNTDYKPANILLSGIGTEHVVAKVGDLGHVYPADRYLNAQPYAMRAPEVYLGHPCTRKSQVWAIAAMILCWIKPGVLGAGDSPHPLLNEPWCMAKLKRLFPNWRIPTPDEIERPTLKADVKIAKRIANEEPIPQEILPFDEETRKVKIPEQLRDLLRLMLVVNPEERPSASTVMASREFWAFQML